jgi:hypothetical protein
MKQGSILIIVGLLLAGGVLHADEARSLERLRINHAAMVSSEQDFHDRQRRGTLSGVEATDYAAYVARLHRLVAEDCAELALAGVSLPSELGCPTLTPSLLVPAPIDQAAEQTLDEQLAVLDAELMSGLGDFDEMLLREQDRVRAKAPMSDAGGAGGGGDGVGDGSGDGSGKGSGEGDAGAAEGSEGESAESGEGTEASQGTGGANAGMGGRESGPRTQRDGQRRGVPGNIPNGDDDDVVARQLREAAEKETSPELKAKLWEEYRKYKEGTG